MIYLDSAATTLQKPPAVARAVAAAMQSMASPGRGGHRPAVRAADTAFTCRELAATLFQVDEPDRVVFTFNATHGLNIAIHSLIAPGDKVLISGFEHNAVTRPLYAMPGVTVAVAKSPLFDRQAILDAFEMQMDDGVRAVVCTQVSNVFGFILPIEEIAALCRTRGVPLIVDAAQGAGCVPIRMDDWGAAYVAMPGHKGLYGPQGTGLLLCGKGMVPNPLMLGGTGSASNRQSMPDYLPDRLEAGTHNIPGIAGLLEGLRYVKAKGEKTILAHEQALITQMTEGIGGIQGVEAFAGRDINARAGVLSFRVTTMDCETVGTRLAERDIAVRAGLHCAPTAHNTACTGKTGTVRASVSAFNTAREVSRFIAELEGIVRRR